MRESFVQPSKASFSVSTRRALRYPNRFGRKLSGDSSFGSHLEATGIGGAHGQAARDGALPRLAARHGRDCSATSPVTGSRSTATNGRRMRNWTGSSGGWTGSAARAACWNPSLRRPTTRSSCGCGASAGNSRSVVPAAVAAWRASASISWCSPTRAVFSVPARPTTCDARRSGRPRTASRLT